MRCRRPTASLPGLGLFAMLTALDLGSASPSLAQEMVAHYGRWLTAEEAASDRTTPVVGVSPSYGVASTSAYTMGACEAGSRDNTHTYDAVNCAMVRPVATETQTAVGFPFHLPNGSLITSITINYFDNQVGSQPSIGAYASGPLGGLTSIVGMTFPVFDGGDNSVTFNVDPPVEVDNANSYVILAILSRSGATYEGMYSARVNYRLQVSPAPLVATFTDVPTDHVFFRFVEALAQAGITGGCGSGLYCPNQPVTRGQMAVFLSIALGLHFPN